MELVQGETLGGTLTGPVPVDTALKYAAQIASALDAAHEKGIIHRDLKPANIMLTPDGVIKVLDFGLAAVTQPSGESPGDPNQSPTLTMGATQAGTIMGTAAYMSPEQASGKPVDRRADIWSFGVVLWEMLTGKRLFEGETISHTLAAVLTQNQDLQQVPVKARRLLQSCLQKDAEAAAASDGRLAAAGGRDATGNRPRSPEQTAVGGGGRALLDHRRVAGICVMEPARGRPEDRGSVDDPASAGSGDHYVIRPSRATAEPSPTSRSKGPMIRSSICAI